MKLTISPSEPTGAWPTVTIEVHGNDLTATQLIEDLVLPALVAAGFHEPSVLRALKEVGGE